MNLTRLKASRKLWQRILKRAQAREKQARAKINLRNGQITAAKAKKAARAHPTVMYDAVTVSNIPSDAPAAAGYIGGRFPTFANGSLHAHLPHARLVSIAVASTINADVLDVEPGDAPPNLADDWVKRQHARGLKRPGVYTSVSGAQALVNLLAANGIPRSSYRLWTAHYTHQAHRCGPQCGFGMKTTADATQWTDKSHGRSLDESLCAPSWWT